MQYRARADAPRTWYLGAPQMLELVRQLGLSACTARVAERIERDLQRWSDFDKSARVASYSDAGVIELMPITDAQHFTFKYVNGHPGNPALGLPTVMAFGVLADVATGAPRLLAELTLLTAIRTAAMSALVARRLARAGSRVMALLGKLNAKVAGLVTAMIGLVLLIIGIVQFPSTSNAVSSDGAAAEYIATRPAHPRRG